MIVVVSSSTEEAVDTAVPAPANGHLTWTLRAPWLGAEWNLTDFSAPVVKLRGALGLGQTDPDHWWSESPSLDGAQWLGSHIGRGEVFLPLHVRGESQASFEAAHDGFMDALDPSQEAVLRITRPTGQWRERALRYVSGADAPVTFDPVAAMRVGYGITWTAADPFWSGAPISVSFAYEDPPDFFPGPPFLLASAVSLANASVTNPGQVPSPPMWRVTGPCSGFSVGVGPAVVAMERTLLAGEWVDIDMTPSQRTILDQDGADAWDDVTDVEFADIPAGVSALTTQIDDAGPGSTATLTFTPRYRRAW